MIKQQRRQDREIPNDTQAHRMRSGRWLGIHEDVSTTR